MLPLKIEPWVEVKNKRQKKKKHAVMHLREWRCVKSSAAGIRTVVYYLAEERRFNILDLQLNEWRKKLCQIMSLTSDVFSTMFDAHSDPLHFNPMS